MKNQYFGDVNDYHKYGLLRKLQKGHKLRLTVAWMLTPDDQGQDGRFRSYLARPEEWRAHDPALFDELKGFCQRGNAPSVLLLERSDLLPRASFYSVEVPDGKAQRREWSRCLTRAAVCADWVFLDPENGIEVRSRPIGRKGSSKYVLWADIEQLWASEKSLLIYQHYPRVRRAAFIDHILGQLSERTEAAFVGGFTTTRVLFLLAAQQRHFESFHVCRDRIVSSWHGRIEPVGW